MTDRAALVVAIEAEPDSDLPRLAWADWLDERGDARDRKRAELIRLQCGGAPPEAVERVLDTLGRVWPVDLLPTHWVFRKPRPGDDGPNLRTHFHRGCLTGVAFGVADYTQAIAAFVGREPLLEVELFAGVAVPPGLADCPHLRRVRELVGDGFGRLLASPHLTGLRAVTACSPDEVATLAGGPAATRVRRLSVLGDGDDLPGDLARVLADAPAFAGLETLQLRGCGLTTAHYRTLIASPHLAPTLRLDIAGSGRPRPGSPVARALAARFPEPPS